MATGRRSRRSSTSSNASRASISRSSCRRAVPAIRRPSSPGPTGRRACSAGGPSATISTRSCVRPSTGNGAFTTAGPTSNLSRRAWRGALSTLRRLVFWALHPKRRQMEWRKMSGGTHAPGRPARMSADDILVTESLSKSFGDFRAVSDVSLRVERGTIHALIGPNGAGKTTCFNMLTKFTAPSAGRITFNGRDITAMRPADVARLGLVRSFQISAVFPHLTALENVRIALQRKRGDSFDFWRSKSTLEPLNGRALELLVSVGLTSFAYSKAGEISYGRKRALELATTLAVEPEMMLLGQPMAGRGREDIDRIAELIRRVSANRTILMVEHNLQVVANLSHRITVLTRGRVLAEGDYRTVSENEEVREAYMGAGHA